MKERTTNGSRLSPRARRLIRSYGLLVLIAIGFLILALMVRERPKTVPVQGLQRMPAEALVIT